eukprot:SAG31_NODE_2296_length_5987_cov_13.607677_3_plen_1013_part_00
MFKCNRQGEILFSGNFDNASWSGDGTNGEDWLDCISNVSALFKRRGWLAINHGSIELRGTDFSPGNRSWNMAPISRFIEAMGDTFLGNDIGEKDGAFIEYVNQELFPNPPTGSSRFANYFQFYSYLEQFNAVAGPTTHGAARLNFMAGSFTGPAVAARTGLYNYLTNEGGQFLPNDQLFYSIIRGASKQYAAAPWSDVSTWGVDGTKCYYCGSDRSKHFQPAPPPPPGANYSFCCPEPGGSGPDCGLSLMAMKRLPYQAMMYGAWFIGSDGNPSYPGCLGGICANHSNGTLNPGGMVQRDQRDFALRVGGSPTGNPGLGVMLVPIALLVDVFSGFMPPRQNGYTADKFRVWSNRRYEASDFWTHSVFDLLYQGYADCGSLHTEQGYTAPTPFGDAADVISSDVAPWVLRRYQLVIVSSSLEFGPLEVKTKIEAHLRAGGDVFITGKQLAALPGGLLGMSASSCDTLIPAGRVVVRNDTVLELQPWRACVLHVPSESTPIATTGGRTVAAQVELKGGGRLVAVASAHGVPDSPVSPPTGHSWSRNPYRADGSLASPYPMLRYVHRLVSNLLKSTVLFEAGPGLSIIQNRRADGSYVLSVANGGLNELPMQILSHVGPIQQLVELPIGRGESECQGYLPCGYPASTPIPRVGLNTNSTIRGGDIRFFSIRLNDSAALVKEIVAEVAPSLPHGRGLPLRSATSIRTELIRRPSFLQHFDTVVVDHMYLGCSSVGTSNKTLWGCLASPATLRSDAFWLSRDGPGPNGLSVVADLTALIAVYTMCQIDEDPGAIENDAPPPDRLNTSKRVLAGALERATMAGARDVIMGLHMLTTQDDEPNDHQTAAKQMSQFVTSIRWFADMAAAMNVTVHMRHTCYLGGFLLPANGLAQMLAFVKECDRPNLRVAASLAALTCGPANETSPAQVVQLLQPAEQSSLVGSLLLSTSQQDFLGSATTLNARLSDLDASSIEWDTLRELAKAVQKGVGRWLPVWLDSWTETLDEEFAEVVAIAGLTSD